MGKEHLRNDTECEECGYPEVTMTYCPKCGQKNVETRQSFGHLITHFAEDFTHYDGAFWKTIKYLLFRPSKLTKEYLDGHRQRYVPPVKLYIFISFVTFLLLSLLSGGQEENIDSNQVVYSQSVQIGEKKATYNIKTPADTASVSIGRNQRVRSIQELDSLRALPAGNGKKVSWLQYKIAKAGLNAIHHKVSQEQIKETIFHTLPKVLFIYMPIFAFWLWLFHGKKRWYFFDHGIFTLHYFAFLLLSFIIISIVFMPFSYIENTIGQIIAGIVWFIYLGYSFFYFFRAHRKMYGETRAISRLKSLALFVINMVCIVFVLIISMIYIMVNLH